MANLKETLEEKIPLWRSAARELLKENADTVVSRITVKQLFKGWRGVNAVLCDTSYVDPKDGLYIRGIPVLELIDRSAEEIFFLLCTGELPSPEALQALENDIQSRAEVPKYVWRTLMKLPEDTHPMTMLSIAMLAMQRESVFLKRYNEGMAKTDRWEATLEDALNIIARLPVVAATIYRVGIQKKEFIPPQPGLNFSDNFANMLGIEDPNSTFKEFVKRFVVVHSDHEGANASVLTSRVVNSSLSDLYYSISGAMNSLAGPLHGLANQESVKFVQTIETEFGGVPEKAALKDYTWNLLQSGKVIPGFGHAVLRFHDPRYTALFDFGKTICPNDTVFRIVEMLGNVVPPLLKKQGKAKNPYPNIDGISGALLYHFGMTDLGYYTVMFSVAQILGICAQLIAERAVFGSIFRPKSVTTRWLQSFVKDVY